MAMNEFIPGLDTHLPLDTTPVSTLPMAIRQVKYSTMRLVAVDASFEDGVQDGDLVYPDLATKTWRRSLAGDPVRKNFYGVATIGEHRSVIVGPGVRWTGWQWEPGTRLYLSAARPGKFTTSVTSVFVGMAIAPDYVMLNLDLVEVRDVLAGLLDSVEELEVRLEQAVDEAQAAAQAAEDSQQVATQAMNNFKDVHYIGVTSNTTNGAVIYDEATNTITFYIPTLQSVPGPTVPITSDPENTDPSTAASMELVAALNDRIDELSALGTPDYGSIIMDTSSGTPTLSVRYGKATYFGNAPTAIAPVTGRVTVTASPYVRINSEYVQDGPTQTLINSIGRAADLADSRVIILENYPVVGDADQIPLYIVDHSDPQTFSYNGNIRLAGATRKEILPYTQMYLYFDGTYWCEQVESNSVAPVLLENEYHASGEIPRLGARGFDLHWVHPDTFTGILALKIPLSATESNMMANLRVGGLTSGITGITVWGTMTASAQGWSNYGAVIDSLEGVQGVMRLAYKAGSFYLLFGNSSSVWNAPLVQVFMFAFTTGQQPTHWEVSVESDLSSFVGIKESGTDFSVTPASAGHADSADFATNATHAISADSAANATYATSAGSANTATSATTAGTAGAWTTARSFQVNFGTYTGTPASVNGTGNVTLAIPGWAYGTAEMTPGTSPLPTGQVYFQYE